MAMNSGDFHPNQSAWCNVTPAQYQEMLQDSNNIYQQPNYYSNATSPYPITPTAQTPTTLEQLQLALEKLNKVKAITEIGILLEGVTDTQLEMVKDFIHMIQEEQYG